MKQKSRTKATTRGMGSVYKPTYRDRLTGDMRESPMYSIGYYIDDVEGPGGQKKRKFVHESANTDDHGTAMRLLGKRQNEHKDGTAPTTAQRALSFDDCMDLVDLDYFNKKRKSSLYRLRKVSRPKLASFFGGWKATAITGLSVMRYHGMRTEEQAAPATINREVAALKRGLRLARKLNLIAAVPMMDMLPENNVRQGFFELSELDAVKKHLNPRYHPIVDVAYHTGWRVKSELLSRRWTDIDFAGAGKLMLYVGEAKDKKVGRVYQFTKELRLIFEKQRAYVDEIEQRTGKHVPWVFVRSTGEKINGFYAEWNRACELAGVKRILHDFRRTAVRNLEERKISRPAAMQMVGHKTEAMYRRYTIVDQNMLDDATRRQDEYAEAQAAKAAQPPA